MPEAGIPVVFVHGLWLHAQSWSPWLELFRERGYEPSAPGWPGEPPTVLEARASPDRVAGYGVAEVSEHFAQHLQGLEQPAVVVGHSFGGLIAQRLLGQGLARAAVAIDPAPIKGVLFLPPSALRVASVALRDPRNLRRAVALDRGQFRYGFGNALPREESDELHERWSVPSPGKPLFQAAAANLVPGSPASVATRNATRGPLLLTAGALDRTVPPTVVRQAARQYAGSGAVTELRELPGKGHSLTVDHGWREVADVVLAWLDERL
jgi:pimeloyl-ACP methyl ester carboxylesterase